MRPPKVTRAPRLSTSLKSPSSDKKLQCFETNGCIRSPGRSSPGPSKEDGDSSTSLRNGRVRDMGSVGNSVDADSKTVFSDLPDGARKRRCSSLLGTNLQPVVKKPCIEENGVSDEKTDECELRKTPSKFALAHVVTSKERQFKWAIRLYRYLNTKNSAFDASARSRLFLKRNLVYMNPKSCGFDSKSGMATIGPCSGRGKCPERTAKQKFDNLLSVVEHIYQERAKKCSFGSPSDRMLGSFITRTNVNNKSSFNSPVKNDDKGTTFSEPTAVMKFIDVRNKDLPGSRRARITVHTASEVDGIFGEIRRLQAATTFMQVNVKRSKPIGIDLPRGIGTLNPKQKKRNDYVILRVVFSEEENAKITGGRTLRCVPSRQAETAETKVTRRCSIGKTASPSSSNDDALVMYGARCVASVSRSSSGSGVLYGDGSINLVPSEWIGTRNVLGRDGLNAKKLLELGKKNHTGPFVKIIVAPDVGEESSSSEEDEETKSCSTSRSTSVCSNRSKVRPKCVIPEVLASNSSEDSFQSFLKARYKRDLSLHFPKEICYRFITRYNDEPDTAFPESVFRSISDIPPNWDICSEAKDLSENIVNGVKTPVKKFASPLREVDAASPLKEIRRFNGVFCSPPKPFLRDTSASLKASVKLVNGCKGKSRQHLSRLDSLALGFSLDELLSSDSIEEYSLVETIDNCGAMGSFERFFMPSPKKAVYCDNTATSSSLGKPNSNQPENSGIVTRCISPPNKCFFCLGTFPDMFALLLHMRTSYPRLDIVYRGDSRKTAAMNRAAPVCIDIFLREDFDGSYEGSMSRQYRNFRDPNVSQRCIPTDRLTCLVLKGEARAIRNMRRDLSMFFSKADREKRSMKGINSAYFGFRSRHPLMDSSRLTTKQIDQEWLRMYIIRQIEDFLDLSRLEKDFLILWNIFLLNLDHKPFGRCHLYRTCRLFLQKHYQDIVAKNLTTAWTLHLAAFHEREALDADEVYDLIMRLNDPEYDPEKDVCHIVYSTRQRQKAAMNSRKEPKWPKGPPITGPKVFSLRSSSAAKLSTADTNSDNEELFKKIRESKEREERSSSYAGEERPKHGQHRRREPNLKFLLSPKVVKFSRNS